MIICKHLNREFSTRDEQIKALKDNLDRVIQLKKSAEKRSDGLPLRMFTNKSETEKSPDFVKDGFIYPIINTCGYLDSHDDVHIPGLWKKSVKEQQGKIFYVCDHAMEIDKVIAYPEDVEILVETVPWKSIGFEIDGETEALIFKTNVFDYSNDSARKAIEQKKPVQNSVRMHYVKIEFCVNSENEYYKMEKVNWEKHYPMIVNKEDADKNGYFFAIIEAKIHKEGSMVLIGSNKLTNIQYADKSHTSTKEISEPSEDTMKLSDEFVKIFFNDFSKINK
jgi:hypothetical protein